MSAWKEILAITPDQSRIEAALLKLGLLSKRAGADPKDTFDQLRAALIGPNYRWYIARFDTSQKSFVWPAALLGPFWFGWRKMPWAAALRMFVAAVFIAIALRYGRTNVNFAIALPIFVVASLGLAMFTTGRRALEIFRASLLTRTVEAIETSEDLDQLSKKAYVVGGVGFGGIAAGLGAFVFGGIASLLVIANFFPVPLRGAPALVDGLVRAKPVPAALPSVPPAVQRSACEINEVQVNANSFLVQNQMDFGYTVKGIIRNGGPDGALQLVSTLSTSEGEYQRSRSLWLKAGAIMTVSFDFPEPTVGAGNIQGRIGCRS